MFAKSFVDHGSRGSGGDTTPSEGGADLPLFLVFSSSSSGETLKGERGSLELQKHFFTTDTHLFFPFAVAPVRLCLENFFFESDWHSSAIMARFG